MLQTVTDVPIDVRRLPAMRRMLSVELTLPSAVSRNSGTASARASAASSSPLPGMACCPLFARRQNSTNTQHRLPGSGGRGGV